MGVMASSLSGILPFLSFFHDPVTSDVIKLHMCQ